MGRKFYIISTVLVVLIIGGAIFWRNIKYLLVKQQIHQAVTENSGGLYRLSYKNLMIDEVAGNISVEDVHLSTDSLTFLELSKQKKNPPARIDIQVPLLEITGVKTPKALLGKELEGSIVNIQSAMIQVSPEKQTDQVAGNMLGEMIYQQVLGNLRRIKVDSLLFHNITFIIKDPGTGREKFKGSGFYCGLSDILIDSLHQNDSSRILFAKEIAVRCRNLSLQSKNKQYKYIFSGLDYNSMYNRLQASKITIEPQLSESAFADAHTYSKDRYHFVFDNLDIRNINRFALFSQRMIADTAIISNSSFHIFRDISHPHDSVDRTDAYPQQLLMKMPLPINIHKIILIHSFVEYKEKNAKSDSSGRVQFFAIHALLNNVTNIPEFIAKNNRMQLDFKSLFLNRAPFHAVLTMILKDPAGKFTLNAKMGGMHAVELNPLLQPLALAKMNRGEIKSLTYYLDGDKVRCTGKLSFLYNNIKVILLKKDESKNKYKTRLLPTLAAGLVVKDSNPARGETRVAHVVYTRDKYRSIFNLMWKSLFTGIKETAGMK